MTTAEKVVEVVADHLGCSPEQVSLESNFIEDLGADSLDLVEIVMAVEEEFGFEIPDDDAEAMTTVQSVVTYLENRKITA